MLEVMRYVLLCILEAVEGVHCLPEGVGGVGGTGGDTLCATPYAGGCGRCAVFAGGVGGAGGDVLCALCMLEAVECRLRLLEVLEVPEVTRCVLFCMLEVMRRVLSVRRRPWKVGAVCGRC